MGEYRMKILMLFRSVGCLGPGRMEEDGDPITHKFMCNRSIMYSVNLD